MISVTIGGKLYTFEFAHLRSVRHFWGQGLTIVYVSTGNEENVSEVSYCSHSDTFDETRGEKEALKRLMSRMPWTKAQRRRVWEAYLEPKREGDLFLKAMTGFAEAIVKAGQR